MHKSRLAGFIIDCRTDDLDAAAAFWGGALGMETRALPGEEDKYIELVYPGGRNRKWEYRLTGSDVTLTIRTLKVNGDRDSLQRAVARLARFLSHRAER